MKSPKKSLLRSDSISSMDEFHVSPRSGDTSLLIQLKTLWGFKGFPWILLFTFTYIAAGYMPSVFMPAYGAEWFAGCTDSDEDCDFDYTSYQFYQSLFMSIRGLVSFLFAGFIGRASDAYGRKIFLILNVVFSFLPYIPLLFVYNLWPYFFFYVLMGLNGSNNSATPVMAAYISDSLPPHLRTVGYGAVYCIAGVGLFAGMLHRTMFCISTFGLFFVGVACARILKRVYPCPGCAKE